jgi:hypothetical protein
LIAELAQPAVSDVAPTIDVQGCAPAPRGKLSLAPALASGLLHAALVCMLGWWALPANDTTEPLALLVRATEELPVLNAVVARPQSQAEVVLGTAAIENDRAALVAQLTAALGAAEQKQPLSTPTPTDLATALAELTSAESGGTGEGAPASGASGRKPIRFFAAPLYPTQRSFVFVVDASGSMHGKRFDRARQELMSTLEQLEPTQQFYVVFFNEYDFPQFHPQRTREYLPATPENLRRVQEWMTSLRAAGDTHPMSSLRKGLELRPDALYLLSDGAFEVRTLSLIRQFNKHGTTIHTIGLEDPAGEALLKAIAEENRGEYHFVK